MWLSKSKASNVLYIAISQGGSVSARASRNWGIAQGLNLWKDADSDIPILIAAKAEYAKML